MALVNRCWFRSVSGGLGDFVVASAITGYYTPAQCQNPSAVDGSTYRYVTTSDDETQHEEGEGAYTVASQTVARTTVFSSSNAGAKVNFSAAPKVMLTDLAQDFSGSGLDVDTTTVTDGAIGRVFYHGAGDVVREYEITGTGKVVMDKNPSFRYGNNEVALLIDAAAVGPGLDDPVLFRIDGGGVEIVAADVPAAVGGAFAFQAGGGDEGGGYSMLAGNGDTGDGGNLNLAAGNSNTGGGGNVAFTAGGSQQGNAGGVALTAGNSEDGNGGNVTLTAGTSDNADNGNIFANLPSGDPGIPNALYRVAGAVMISL